MRCPVCSKILDRPLPECDQCGLSLSSLDPVFGPVPRTFGSISDHLGLFSRQDRGRIIRLAGLLEKKFPQVRFTLFAAAMRNRPARAYGFWLFNRSRFTEAGMTRGRNFSLLLFINPLQGEASLTAGYGLEQILDEAEIEKALKAAAVDFAGRRWYAGVVRCINSVIESLRARAQSLPEEKPAPAPPASDTTTVALQEA